jgi:hypothetical protein
MVLVGLTAVALGFAVARASAAPGPLHPCALASEAEVSSIFAPVNSGRTSGFGGWYRCWYYTSGPSGDDVVEINEYDNPCKVVSGSSATSPT